MWYEQWHFTVFQIETYTDEDEDLLIPNREDEPDDDSAILNV